MRIFYGNRRGLLQPRHRTVDYNLNREKHHAKRNFVQEWKMLLKRHGLVD